MKNIKQMLNSNFISKAKVKSRFLSGKNKLFAFAFAAIFFKLLFLPQFASAQNSRIWATYYGGTGDEITAGAGIDSRYGSSVATDASGNVYLLGNTNTSKNLASGGFQDSLYNGNAIFLVKFDANGNRLWATYYGHGNSYSASVATDAAGNVYMAGATLRDTGLALNGFKNTPGDEGNAFLVKFDANGNRLWGTYYGADSDNGTLGSSVATDAAGNVYLAGQTSDTIGIASGGFHNTYGGGLDDAFLVKFDANGNRLWATYYGGTGGEDGRSVATDAAGNVYLAGYTNSSGLASGGFQDTLGGDTSGGAVNNAYLVKFNASGNRLWATYYGMWLGYGGGDCVGNSVATDIAGNVYLAGATADITGIASGGFHNTYGGGLDDAFLVKFDANGNRLWATYYGGNGEDNGESVSTDAAGNVYMAGFTTTKTGIASTGVQNSCSSCGGDRASSFLVKFNAGGSRQCATYYGIVQTKSDNVYLALDNVGDVYVASYTDTTAGIASGGFQNTYGGGAYDTYLVKFCPCSNCIIIPVANFQSSETAFCANKCINYTDSSTNVTSWHWSFPGGTPSSSTIQNPQGICYDSAGTFDVKLIASNGIGTDTLTSVNYIRVFPSPPTPVITQRHDTLFSSTNPSYTSYQWYDSTTIIPGATDTFLIITHGGNYNVVVTNENGCKISVGITIAHNVGINEFSANNYISLYPNPASDQLLIHTSSSHITGKAIISIINVLGEIIQEEKLKWSNDIILDIKNIPPGIYFLQMKTVNGIDTKRFVKE